MGIHRAPVATFAARGEAGRTYAAVAAEILARL
jgi:hypothetical protein